MINGNLIFPTRTPTIDDIHPPPRWTHTAREHVAGAVPAGRDEAGAIVDRIRSHIGSFPGESHGLVQAAHDANQTVPVSNADIRVSRVWGSVLGIYTRYILRRAQYKAQSSVGWVVKEWGLLYCLGIVPRTALKLSDSGLFRMFVSGIGYE